MKCENCLKKEDVELIYVKSLSKLVCGDCYSKIVLFGKVLVRE